MAQYRHIQFYRGGVYDDLSTAKSAMENQLANLKDGEIILGTYDDKRTLIGVAHIDNSGNSYLEIFYGNEEVSDLISNAINGLDATGNGTSTNVDVTVTETDGKITSVTVTDRTADAIANAINALDSSAAIASKSNNTITIKGGITETNGEISNTAKESAADVVLYVDDNATDNHLVSSSTVDGKITNAINGLDSTTNIATKNETTGEISIARSITETDGIIKSSIHPDSLNASFTLRKVASTGASEDVSYKKSGETTNTTVEAALDELYTGIATAGKVDDVKINGSTIVSNKVADIAVDGTYDSKNNKIATQSTVTNAINALNDEDSENPGYVVVDVVQANGKIKTSNKKQLSINGQAFTSDTASASKISVTIDAEDIGIDAISGITSSNIQGALSELKTLNDGKLNPVTAVSATDLFKVTSLTSGTGNTVQAKKYSQATTAQSTIADGSTSFTVGDGSLKLKGFNNNTASTEIFSANDTANSEIEFGTEFVPTISNSKITKISINTNQTASNNNKIATMNDIASLSGAMHFKGALNSTSAWPTTVAAGDTYIANGKFTHETDTIEIGDLIVFTSASAYSVIQSNLTVDAESTSGTTTIKSDSSNATVPTSKNVYDAIQSLSVNSVTDALSLSVSSGTATLSDTLKVDGQNQAASSVTITGNKDIKVEANGTNSIKIGHTTGSVTPTTGTAVTVDEAGETTTITVPSLTIDDYGHITAEQNTSYTIKLPESIGTAIQTVTGENNVLNNSEFVNVKSVKDGTNVTLSSTVKIGRFGLNITGDNKWHYIGTTDNIDLQVGDALSILSDASAPFDGTSGWSTSYNHLPYQIGSNGFIDPLNPNPNTNNKTVADDFGYNSTKVSYIFGNTELNIAKADTRSLAVFRYISTGTVSNPSENGLATINEIEAYVDTKVKGEKTKVTAGTGITVSGPGTNNTYTVGLSKPTISKNTSTNNYSDTTNTHTEISSITVDEYGRVTAYTTTTVTEDWDCGTY